ncbi:MAG: 4a-hydroxytetrahydrobiopterin dehydratase [Candidatus Nanoarchaeia archaeon]
MNKEIENWQYEDKKISKEITFPDFKSALTFVNKVGKLAEEAGHHPDIELGYGRVKISLTTHSEGKVTDEDINLAQQINNIQNGT